MPALYDDDHRTLQDRFDSRALADTLEFATVKPFIDDEAKTFIEARAFFFLSTVNSDGHPTVSHKGGAPGFVRVVDPTTLVFPSYDGNGMFLSMGNIANNGRIGLLFIDFNTPHRIRAHANAVLVHDGPLLGSYPGADLVVKATIAETFVNCPRYITKQASSEPAPHVPDANGQAPLAAWKKIDLLQDVLPERFRNLAEGAGGTLGVEEYEEQVRRGQT